jgi:DNA-binding NarL/FixJ family response regulator
VIRIVLIDALGLVRSGVRILLQSADAFAVLGEGESADDAVHLARQFKPDVLLLDRAVEGALAAVRAIKETVPACDVVVLTNRLTQNEAHEVFAAGASGYVCKDIPGGNLLAVLQAMRTPGAPRPILASARSPLTVFRAPPAPHPTPPNGLTARELEILAQLATGNTDTEIARHLHVHEGTVKTHIRNILRKLGVRNRTAAIAHALRERLIT